MSVHKRFSLEKKLNFIGIDEQFDPDSYRDSSTNPDESEPAPLNWIVQNISLKKSANHLRLADFSILSIFIPS